jgi:hypothetical protein
MKETQFLYIVHAKLVHKEGVPDVFNYVNFYVVAPSYPDAVKLVYDTNKEVVDITGLEKIGSSISDFIFQE